MSENEKKNKYFREYMQDHYDADVKSFRYYKSKYKLTDESLRKRFGNTDLIDVKRRAVTVLKDEFKEKNNRVKKITYWKEQYGVEVNDEQYEMFSLHSNKIKKILPILDFVKTLSLMD